MDTITLSRDIKNTFFVVTGIGPSQSGVGQLMQRLLPQLQKDGFQTVIRRTTSSIKQMTGNHEYMQVVMELIARIFGSISFYWKVSKIKNGIILFAHPQTAGFKTLFRLANHGNRVFFYVMDNSFFCLRSYNHRHGRECLICLGNPDQVAMECKPFPAHIPKRTNTNYLVKLMKYSQCITFLAQNENQKRLITRHFGSHVSCYVVGMLPADIEQSGHPSGYINHEKKLHAEIVYHGGLIEAKGIRYVIELAKKMPERTILIPYTAAQIKDYLSLDELPENVSAITMTWDTGLRQMVEAAEIVLVPSLWSSPIEGALVKSLKYNGAVATVATHYGFEEELKNMNTIVRLPLSSEQAALSLNQVWEDLEKYRVRAKRWVSDFYKYEPVEKILSIIHE